MFNIPELRRNDQEKYSKIIELFRSLEKADTRESIESIKKQIREEAKEHGVKRVNFPTKFKSESDIKAYKEMLLKKLKG